LKKKFTLINSSCYLEIQSRPKASFAANCTDFREFEKKSVQISEISGKDFGVLGMVATWVN
jgi:hypothetical protein